MPKVTVVGSTNVDYGVRVTRLPQPGETVLGHGFSQSVGGKGANQAMAAQLAGAEVAFVTKLGNDPNGDMLNARLMARGFPAEGLLRTPERQTGTAIILVDPRGENMIAVVPGSNEALTVDEIRAQASWIAGAEVLLLQLEIPVAAVAEALAVAKRHDVLTILNPAPARPLSLDVLHLVDILTPNELEARALTGQEQSAAAVALLRQGVRAVVLTRGARGAWLEQADGGQEFSPYPAHAIDSTAAGDAFNGALACALSEGRDLIDAIDFANAAGALATTKPGAADALPRRADINALRAEGH